MQKEERKSSPIMMKGSKNMIMQEDMCEAMMMDEDEEDGLFDL